MRAVIATVLLATLAACASNKTAEQNLILDKDIQGMTRNEVITAITECETSGTRAVMVYAKRKINGYTTDVTVDVTCAPKPKF